MKYNHSVLVQFNIIYFIVCVDFKQDIVAPGMSLVCTALQRSLRQDSWELLLYGTCTT